MAAKIVKLNAGKPAGYRVVKNAAAAAAEIYLYGVIGGDWFGDGVTAKQVADDLKAIGKVKTIDVHINSEGGSVFDGKAIYALLVANSATINVMIDGLAASAASFIAMAGKTITIAEGAMMMIHNAVGICYGGVEDMRSYANLLETVNNSITDVYVARTKNDAGKVKKWMDEETWFTAQDAVDNGFADTMTENLNVAASITHPQLFKKLPNALLPRRAAAQARLDALKRT